MRSNQRSAIGINVAIVAALAVATVIWSGASSGFAASPGVAMNPAYGGMNPGHGGMSPAVGRVSSPNPVYSRGAAPRIYSSSRSVPVTQGTVRGLTTPGSSRSGAGRVIAGSVSSPVTGARSVTSSPRAIATVPRTPVATGVARFSGQARSRVHTSLGPAVNPSVQPGGFGGGAVSPVFTTASPIITPSSPIITPASPITTNVRPAIANPAAPLTPINTSPVVNPWPTVPGKPGCPHVCRPGCGHRRIPGGCFGFVPVCSPVFFTPVVPYYSDTYVIREQPVQQFIIIDRQPEEPKPPEQPAAEQGPPVQPGARQAAAEQEAEVDRPRGVARLPDDLLQQLMIEGTELFHRGDYHEAAKRFFRVTMADRLNTDATLAYAVARFATGDYQVASLAVRRGVRRFPEVVDSAFDIRARYGDPKDFESHLIKLEEFVRQNPDDVDGWVVLGFVRHFSGQRELAAQTFARLREQAPSDAALADIFLNAKPLPAPAQPDEAGGAATAPATTGAAPLPGGSDVEDEAKALITIE